MLRVEWTKPMLERLKSLVLAGFPTWQIADKLSAEFHVTFTTKSVETAKYRYGCANHCLPIDKDITIYKELNLPADDYMMSCDYHSPYHSEIYINRLLFIADLLGIKKNIVIGDLFDMDFAKKWYSDGTTDLDKEFEAVDPVIKALSYFDMNYLVQGNHEMRIGRMTDGKIQAQHLFRIFGKDIWDKKFRYTNYDKLTIDNKWLLVHPKSYSQVSPAVARRLAEKFHRNVINSHGHLVGMSYDRSGEHLAVDLGGMFQRNKIEYINKSTTTHPIWKNGFGAIRNGKFWHFTDATDWKFWGIS